MPGLLDHEAVLADVSITPKLGKRKKRDEVPMFQKANWDDFKVYMTKCKENLMANTQNKTLKPFMGQIQELLSNWYV